MFTKCAATNAVRQAFRMQLTPVLRVPPFREMIIPAGMITESVGEHLKLEIEAPSAWDQEMLDCMNKGKSPSNRRFRMWKRSRMKGLGYGQKYPKRR